jgi:hypothetical protein
MQLLRRNGSSRNRMTPGAKISEGLAQMLILNAALVWKVIAPKCENEHVGQTANFE